MHLAAYRSAATAAAWETPPVRSYAAWLDELWLEHADERGPALTANQSFALWRRVVAESAESGDLIGHAGAAEWAAGAWQLLHRWQIDPAAQRAAANQVDYRAFLGWCRRYRAWLDGHGLIDRAELEAALPARVAARGTLVVADLDGPYPARDRVVRAAGGARHDDRDARGAAAAGTRRAARLADAADELRAAFAWAKRRLAGEPASARRGRRADGRAPAARDRAAGGAELGGAPLARAGTTGRTLAADPAIGAAVDALALSRPRTRRTRRFGRWLRSPFFAAPRDEQFARARLDAELRAELRSQLPFQAAYRCGVDELLDGARAAIGARARGRARRDRRHSARDAEPLGASRGAVSRRARLAAADARDRIARRGRARSTSSRGSRRSSARSRSTARWPSSRACSSARRPPRCRSAACTCSRTSTTSAPVTTPCGSRVSPMPRGPSRRTAIRCCRCAAARARHAVLVAARRAGALRARARAARAAQPRARRQLAGARLRLRDGAEPGHSAVAAALAGRARRADGGRGRGARAARETVADAAPPFAGARVPGGTGALGRQARCPLRAFCQDRLGARRARAARLRRAGTAARHRGASGGRAAARGLACADGVSPRKTGSRRAERRARARARCSAARAAISRRSTSSKRTSCSACSRLCCARKPLRAPFRVRAVEQARDVALGPLTFDVRIDRIDELADGTLAIIDYKTGERATSADWFGDAAARRASAALREPVGRDVSARRSSRGSRRRKSRYSGFWPDGAFPGRPSQSGASRRRRRSSSCGARSSRSSRAEFAAGDTRIFVDRLRRRGRAPTRR